MTTKYKKRNAIIVGDLHIPAMKEGYLEFVRDVKKKYQCGTNIMIGDNLDFAAISYHEKNPGIDNAVDEYNKAKKMLAKWYKLMPNATVLIGNHCSLNQRKATTIGLPDLFLRDHADLFDTPKWNWLPRYANHYTNHLGSEIVFTHGDKGKGGMQCSLKNAKENFINWVQGHTHSLAEINWFANERGIIFGMSVGCGVDHGVLAMEYGRKFNAKPVISCGVIVDGIPMVIPMDFKKYS